MSDLARPFDVETNIDLASFTTFKLGGSAAYFCNVCEAFRLPELTSWAATATVPVVVLGGGSNVLVSDEGVQGLVLRINLRGKTVVREDDTTVIVRVAAGESWDELVAWTVRRGWWGLENLSAIPGSVGASPIQNIGAYGTEVADCILSVEVFDRKQGTYHTLAAAECDFDYRDSYFKRATELIVTHVSFHLQKQPMPRLDYKDLAHYFDNITTAPTLTEIRQAVIDIRSQKFPDLKFQGTAGSFFKNPVISSKQYDHLRGAYPDLPGYTLSAGKVKVPAGWLIDNVLHKRGFQREHVATFTNQALVIVTESGATASAVTEFAQIIQAELYERTGIQLEWEVTKI